MYIYVCGVKNVNIFKSTVLCQNINKTIFKYWKKQMIWCSFYANCTQMYKTLSFNILELCSFRFKSIEKKIQNVKEIRSYLLFNHLLRKKLNHDVGSNFYKGIHVFREKPSSQKPFGPRSCNLCGSIIRCIDNFSTYVSCYLLRSG